MARSRTPNIYPRIKKDGSTVYDTMLSYRDPASGRRKQRMLTFPTKKAALDALAEHRADALRGEQVLPNKMTVADLMRRWLEVHGATVRNTSAEQYASTIALHINPRLGQIRLEDLTAARLEQHYAEMRRSGAGEVATEMTHRRLVQALHYARRHHWVAQNVAGDASCPKAARRRMEVWDNEQLGRFMAVQAQSHFGPVYLLDAHTGLRRGELLGLRWQDINWDQRTLHVRQTIVQWQKGRHVHPTKTGRDRTVAVPQALLDELRRHRAVQNEWRLKCGTRWQDSGLVFTTHLGTPPTAPNLRKEFHRLCGLAGVPAIRLHDVRHSHATSLLNDGWTVADVANRLGHKNASITMNTYLHALPDRYGAMVERWSVQLGVSADK